MAHRLQLPLINLLCSLLLTVTASGQTVPLWGRWDQTFHASTTAAPETELAVELTSPSGQIYSVSGFWDGGATWRVRFMPVEAGTWLYRTRSVPVLEGLDGQGAEFVCQPEAGTTRFLRHGPVRVS